MSSRRFVSPLNPALLAALGCLAIVLALLQSRVAYGQVSLSH